MNKLLFPVLLACMLAHIPTQAASPIWEESVKEPARSSVSDKPQKRPQRQLPKIYIEPDEKEQAAVDEKLKKSEAAAASSVKKSTKPAAGKQQAAARRPASAQLMRTPQYADFSTVKNEAGGYQLAVPKSFGSDPLASLPSSNGPMLLRIRDNNCMCAATVADKNDMVSYRPAEGFAEPKNSRTLYTWQHGSASALWKCTLSSSTDFYGDKMRVKAVCDYQGRSYQLLYVFPAAKINYFLPQALYSLNSFRFLTNE